MSTSDAAALLRTQAAELDALRAAAAANGVPVSREADDLLSAVRELLDTRHDPARKHADDSPAKGRWAVFTVRTELADRIAALAAANGAQP